VQETELKRGRIPLYSLLFALQPLVFLYGHNTLSVTPADAVRPLVVLLMLWAVATLLAKLLVRDWTRAGILVSVSFLFALLGRHILRIIRRLIHTNGYLFLTCILVAMVVIMLVWLLRRSKASFSTVRTFLVALGVLMMAPSAATTIVSLYTMHGFNVRWHQSVTRLADAVHVTKPKGGLPDIYYIILDEHGRQDVLAHRYGYDDSWFTSALRKNGFYVADKSQCNYVATNWSLASSLNMDYLAPMMDRARFVAHRPPRQMAWENECGAVFHKLGYKWVTVASDWSITGRNPFADVSLSNNGLSEFEQVLIARQVCELFRGLSPARTTTLWQIAELAKIARMKEPTFTFVHIVCPHPPYVFSRTGGPPVATSDEGRYIDQLAYVDSLILKAVNKILAESEKPPIIIIQSDHGPAFPTWRLPPDADLTKPAVKDRFYDRLGILNAYYFPGKTKTGLYSSITPVNSFRVLLNTYFDAKLKLLDDMTFIPSRYNVSDDWLPDRMRKCPRY
jgi:hypothetical protein